VSGVREGSPFEGTSGAAPKNSYGSYFALDVTQPDELAGGAESSGTSAAPRCLNKSGDATCARDWPTVLWEITDAGDLDVSGSPGFGYPDMGETWAKAAMGRVKVCTSGCGTSSAVNEDHYVAIFGGGFDRERLNRRGNWLYLVDIETGKTLYKANSSCGGDPLITGCTPTYFGSIPAEPAALDYNDDGYLDLIYVGDLKGQLWRIDLTDLRTTSSPPGGSFRNQLDLVTGSGQPFLLFQAGPATLPVPSAFYPIYSRPEAINLGYNSGGRPALGIAFGTGDRDDITGKVDPASLTYKQRFYYVVDAANTTTTTESTSGMLDIASPTASATSTLPAQGWFLELTNGEPVVGDSLAPGGIIRFPTYNPVGSSSGGSNPCANPIKCAPAGGTSRFYQVYYTTGNPYLSASDRGQTQQNAMFITSETAYLSGSADMHGIYWSGGAQNPKLGVGKKITVRSWKEKTSRP
jgi:type IV pilus assembly protein PilY1